MEELAQRLLENISSEYRYREGEIKSRRNISGAHDSYDFCELLLGQEEE
jgi:hypothetical protein